MGYGNTTPLTIIGKLNRLVSAGKTSLVPTLVFVYYEDFIDCSHITYG